MALHLFSNTCWSDDAWNDASYSDNYEYIFNMKDLNLSNPDLQLANTKTMSKHNIRELSSELKNFYVQSKIILTISEEKWSQNLPFEC